MWRALFIVVGMWFAPLVEYYYTIKADSFDDFVKKVRKHGHTRISIQCLQTKKKGLWAWWCDEVNTVYWLRLVTAVHGRSVCWIVFVTECPEEEVEAGAGQRARSDQWTTGSQMAVALKDRLPEVEIRLETEGEPTLVADPVYE